MDNGNQQCRAPVEHLPPDKTAGADEQGHSPDTDTSAVASESGLPEKCSNDGVLSVMAFHEKAVRSEVGLLVLIGLFVGFSRRAATVANLPPSLLGEPFCFARCKLAGAATRLSASRPPPG